MRRLIKTQNRKKMAYILLAGLCMFGILLTASDGFAISSVASGGRWYDKNTWGGVRVPVAEDIVEINGTVTVDNSPVISGLIVNAGATLTNYYSCDSYGCYGSGLLSVNGDVTNNGTIRNNGPVTSFFILTMSGNIINNGTWNNKRVELNTTQSRSILGNPIQSEVLLGGGIEISNSPVFAGNVSVGSIKLSSGQSITCLKNFGNYGGSSDNIPEGTLILSGEDQKITGVGLTVKEVIFGGTGTKTVNYNVINGKITVQSDVTLTSTSVPSITGDVINNGTITGDSVYLSVSGNITNNGTWNNKSLSLTGTQSRSISGNPIQSDVGLGGFEISNSPVFAGNVNFSSSTKLSAGQSVTCLKNFGSGSTVNIPEGNLILSGGDQKISGTGLTVKEVIFSGTGTKTVNYNVINGKVTVQSDVTLTSTSVSPSITGDVINNGTITGDSVYLSVSGNITNNGTWNNKSVSLTGTQSISISGNPIQSDISISVFEISNSPVFAGNVNFSSSTKLSAGQSVTCLKNFGSASTVNISEGTLILNGGDQKISGNITAKEVIFGGTGTKTVSSMTIGKLAVPKDVTLTGSGTLTVNGDASNSGTITGTSLSLKISGNITNSGTWNNSSTYVFWTPVSGSSFYDFNITDNLSTWLAPTRPGGTSYNVGSLLTSENYWRVRASVSGTLTAWSDVKSINSSGSVPTVKKGDMNGSGGDPDLADAIPVLRILAGISVTETINLNADVNGDGKIGIEEVIYILQIVAGLRTP